MKKLKLYIATSSDGFIAPPDGDLEWLIGYPISSKEDHKRYLDSVDTVIMGGNAYRDMCLMDIIWPYNDKIVYVVTRYPVMQKEGVNFVTENAVEVISKLKKEEGKDIWLVGGAAITSMLLDNHLIDEIIITQISVTLEKGIPLFAKELDKDWVLKEEIIFDNKSVRKTYQYKP